jgi:hypothetical protein
MAVSWYKINIMRDTVSDAIFSGYFKVDNTNRITEFYNSLDESTPIINNDGASNADYLFTNNKLTSNGTNIIANFISSSETNIVNIPNLNYVSAVEWQLYSNYSGDYLDYKTSDNVWHEDLSETEFSFVFTKIPIMPSRFNQLSTTQIQALTPSELRTVLNIVKPTQVVSVLSSLSEDQTVSLTQNAIANIGSSQFTMYSAVTASQSVAAISTIIGKLSSATLPSFIKSISSELAGLTSAQVGIVLGQFSSEIAAKVGAAIQSDPELSHTLSQFALNARNEGFELLSNICFTAGTPILTDQGKINIEQIDAKFHTIRNKKIVCVTKTITMDEYLVCFDKDSIYKNVPSQKTVISKNHKIFYKEKMTKAKDFLGSQNGVYKVKYNKEILYNVMMEEHDKMSVNNMICETLDPENIIGKLHIELQSFTPEKQRQVVQNYNKLARDHYSKKSINK